METVDEIKEFMGKMGEESPEQMKAFHNFMSEVEKDGEISGKMKHLIALGIGVAKRCEKCIVFHTQGALDAGASKQEVKEALWVSVLMDGGPALMYTKKAMDMLE